MTVPGAGAPRPLRLPRVAERSLHGGLRLIAAKRAGVPLAEIRLRIPMPAVTATDDAKKRVLSATLLAGTTRRSDVDIAALVQRLGGTLHASAGTDSLLISGSALATRLPDLLALVADVVTDATYPPARVRNEQDRLAQALVLQRSQPGVIAGEALLKRMYGRHPYGLGLPTPERIRRITPGAVRSYHRRHVQPRGATLVITGELGTGHALNVAEDALTSWDGAEALSPLPSPPAPRPGPFRIVDRPGAVQTNIRLAGPAVARTDPTWADLEIAELVFGGYFASRLVQNVREDKGYSYSPHSYIRHQQSASRFIAAADVASEVTGPALLEMRYELGKLATLPVTEEEIERSARFRIGGLVRGAQTQTGLAGQLHRLLAEGLDHRYLRDHPKRLIRVTPANVLAASRRFLAPDGLVAVLLGDARVIRDQVEPLGPLEVVAAG